MNAKRINLWIMLFLTILTVGLYPWFWIIQRRDFFGNLSTEINLKKSMNFIYAMITVDVISKLIPSGKRLMAFQPPLPIILSLSKLGISVLILYGFLTIVYNYEKKLVAYFQSVNKQVVMKDWLTIIFNVYYLQYKINKEILTIPSNGTSTITENCKEWEI